MSKQNDRINAPKLSTKGVRRKQQSIYFEPGLYNRLDELARNKNATLSALVNDLLREAVEPPGLFALPASQALQDVG